MNARSMKTLFCLSLGTLLLIAAPAAAATMNYGNFAGDDFTYLNVTEENGEPNLLFTAPAVVGNSLVFSPDNFFSEVDPGPGAEIVDSQITTRIVAMAGQSLNNIFVEEAGDFTLVGLADDFAEASVGAAFFVTVTSVDGVPIANGPERRQNMQFTSGGGDNGGEYSLPGDAGTGVIWNGSVLIDVASLLPGENITGVRLSFDNTLTTLSGSATASAFIKKKINSGIIITPNIPEPSTIAMCLLGLVAVVARRGKAR